LSSQDIAKIVDLQIKRVERLMAERKLRLEITPAAKQLIVAEGYDPVYGARPLKRAIQRLMQNPLAMAVLEGEYAEGDTVRVDRSKDGAGLTFERIAATEKREAAEPKGVPGGGAAGVRPGRGAGDALRHTRALRAMRWGDRAREGRPPGVRRL